MRKRKIFLAAAAAFILCMPILVSHADKPEEVLSEEKILSGYPDGELHLENNVTRAEFAKMLMETLEKSGINADDSGKNIIFADVGADHWAYNYIQKAVNAGIINGIDEHTFAPDANITYEQAVKMTMSAFEYISFYANYPADYISEAIDGGYLYGVKALSGEFITRSDAANLLYNALEKSRNETEISGVRYSSSSIANGAGGMSGGGGGAAMQKFSSASGAPMAGGAVLMESAMTDMEMAPASAVYIGENHYSLPFNTEEYIKEAENVFKNASISPLSTFSIDVDTASYSNIRRFILNNKKPDAGSVRTEEMINYFDYDYELPTDGTPFSVTTELSSCPWNSDNKLALIAVKGDEIPDEERKPNNIVFLVDVSGSMYDENKLPLVQRSLSMMLEKLDSRDTISIVTYASGTGIALDSENAENADKIKEVLFSLRAGGGTAGSDGLNLAYSLAEKNKIDGNNRIILCTDGDFNIGPSSTAELEQLIEEKRKSGIYLSVLGFGMGNYKDSRMETLADKGNGNYAYIDNIKEAKKVLVDEMTKTIYTIAKDVKIQVEFNPELVKEYRLVGYENRKLNNEDFDNDAKDAGELGAGSVVTALYEIVPVDGIQENSLRYQTSDTNGSDEYMFVKLRYKDPDGEESKLIEHAVSEETEYTSDNFRFASAVAEFAMILNNSEFKNTSDIDSVIELAESAVGEDKFGLRTEFLQLVDLYRYIENAQDKDFHVDEYNADEYDIDAESSPFTFLQK